LEKIAGLKNTQSFYWEESREPHFHRRKQIMNEVPEVKKLFGIDPFLKYKAIFVLLLQLAIPVFFLPENLYLFALLVVLVGATLSQILFLAIHEITHDLAFESPALNNVLAIIVNFPIVFPFSMAFKVYHAKHHWHQGKDGVDTDLPTEEEALLFKGLFGKLIWLVNQILFYAIRPLLVYPLKPDKWQVINLVVQLILVGIFYQFVGIAGFIYLIASLFVAGGLHPIAGHFIAEHYVFKEGQETYSYYGFLNKITFNVGFHNEHHDFPNIPGSRLPALKKLAASHYDHLYSHTSWSKVLWRFVSEESMTLYARIKRNN
jgi:sphingolipid 4-desaturase/C4-monooxygenase